MTNVKVRFAPSPTGELHIGGARTALFNYLYVHSVGGKLILRIDDTDLERSRSDYIDKLIVSLKWLGLDWDEGPYYQSKRIDQYKLEAERLLSCNKAYYCYCNMEELDAGRAAAREEKRPYLYPGNCRNLNPERKKVFQESGRSPVVRLLTPDHGETIVHDLIRGEVRFDNATLDDFIIIKSNGSPTYNFASVVDDYQMNITHVIRAEEHLSNTPRQQICACALGYDLPGYAHVPMILAPDRSKLSKRHGATAVEEFRSDGYLPEALINYMALLGWSPGGEEEIFSLPEIIKLFSLQRVNKTAAIYDVNKLAWMNSHYMRSYELDQLLDAALPFYEQEGLIKSPLSDADRDKLKQIIAAVRERTRTLVELVDNSRYFYTDSFTYDEKGFKKHFTQQDIAELLRRVAQELSAMTLYDSDTVESLYRSLSELLGVTTGRLIHPTRLALTGMTVGPGLFLLMVLLGKEKSVQRLENAAKYIEGLPQGNA